MVVDINKPEICDKSVNLLGKTALNILKTCGYLDT